MPYEFSAYHIVMALLGLAVVAAYWLPRFVSGREPAASALLIGLGFVAVSLLGGDGVVDPVANPKLWEVASEICVVIGLFGVGLRIDKLGGWTKWRGTVRLLVIAMPLCIAAIAVAGLAFAGMTLAGALLLAAVLAPTDPVLAGDVQVGPPLEGGEHPVRYALTTEAGLNDGLAFPFVYLAMAIATAGGVTGALLFDWLWQDVAYRITLGVAGGTLFGRLLGKVLFDWPKENALASTESALIAFFGVLVVYGMTELVEGYGFIAAFVSGLILRRQESKHAFHAKLHDFVQSIEHVLTAILLVALGAAIPSLWQFLTLPGALIGLGLILVVRPVIGWIALHGVIARGRERAVVAFYGIRGIGSIYYVAYATSHIELVDKGALWATIAFTIVASTIIHGFTAGIALDRATGEVADADPEKAELDVEADEAAPQGA